MTLPLKLRAAAPLLLAAAAALSLPAVAAPNIDNLLDDALDGAHRSKENRARDVYRNPRGTLLFFGLRPDSTVVEISPSAGWYTEILAPVLKERGQYIAAIPKLDDKAPDIMRKTEAGFREKLASNSALYGKAKVNAFDPAAPSFAPAGSADLVVTFRNVHNWAKAGNADAMFKGFYNALKKGGVLGVVEHRAKPGTPFEQQVKTGYMTEDYVIETAVRAGFVLDASIEINANWRDTKDHPGGVWNLPPNLRGVPDTDKPKYLAIGESDRMTLRFVKP